MKESSQRSNVRWIKKNVRSSTHIENLKYLLNVNPHILPTVKIIANHYYVVERCKAIDLPDFAPSNLHCVYKNLLASLHKHKREGFTPGVYKYFVPYPVQSENRDEEYIPHLLDQLQRIVASVSIQQPKMITEDTFVCLFEHIAGVGSQLRGWKPLGGYSLLHGDLHIGNVVKKNRKYLLIDYEYLRYGAKELEIANFVISSLIWQHKKSQHRKEVDAVNELSRTTVEYFEMCRNLPFVDHKVFRFFFALALSLFYLSAYVKSDRVALSVIGWILESHKIMFDNVW